MKTLISGGTVVNSSGPFPADVLVDGETIAGLAAPGSSTSASWREARRPRLDATGST